MLQSGIFHFRRKIPPSVNSPLWWSVDLHNTIYIHTSYVRQSINQAPAYSFLDVKIQDQKLTFR